ncbi:MAG TPA: sigma-70 family RNA polymerase sigma factor [Nevskiaceae bacterium]|nr:sigma-70 family RNA polymerase sigma factor [Nevskiaceae bacterium]
MPNAEHLVVTDISALDFATPLQDGELPPAGEDRPLAAEEYLGAVAVGMPGGQVDHQVGIEHLGPEQVAVHIGELYPKLVAFAQSLVGNRHTAEDVVGNAVRGVIERSLGGQMIFEGMRHVQNYTFQSVRNRAKDEGRRRGVRERHGLNDLVDPVEYANVVSDEGLEESTTDKFYVQHLLNKLPPLQRQVITMQYMDDMTLTQIAEELKIPPGTVRSRLHYALQALKKITAEDSPFA